ncbi:MAG: TatD family hydrolase [Chthoniobacteraceae bacterium]
MLTDTHAHLDFPEFSDDVPAILARAAEAGVTRILTIGTGIESSRRAVALANKWPQVWAVAGVHPNHVPDEQPDFLPTLHKIATGSPRIAAIGETGLDYFRLAKDDTAGRAAQASAFRAQLDLAVELRLPVVIHERAAWDDTLAILREYTGRVRAVFHCFGKTPDHAREVFALGHLVSFTGIVTFKNAPDAQASAATVPLGSFMVETDCPYLAPVPHRGKRCEPAFVRHTAEHIAALRDIPLEELAAATEATANRFFRFLP